ncbi:solute carrier family 35 member F6-like isoform 1-T1 [Salvelinus alpinus]|uniref:Solute carrier family 35 member F6 n=2 Tax=Salvelinus TaxID=8033 RepID=A0A8U0TQL5_SALNM|nr:solute carrier family 35 member F6 [Salvelinus alpinus]XP_038824206.1 solute carrier family 35 member F6-like [Salvelinus namaycush]XP_055729099.1 solute carrier family 35 member F6-like [Salvelinus fontinalis]
MAWTKYQLFLAGLMLTTGSINTLSAKWADMFSAKGCKDSTEHTFNHPFVQAVGMFLGELSCLAVFHMLLCHDRRRPEPKMNTGQSFNPLLFLPPALCDMTATSIMYVALNMTSASSFQMLRGAVIIFTGLLSVAFLGRRLVASQWTGIFVTILGLVMVGLADFISGNKDDSHKLSEVITGDLLIIMAQVIAAVQMVLEEKFVYKHDVHPLRAVGTEGFFGFFILSLLLIPFFYIPVGSFSNNPRHVLEDALDAFCQIGHNPMIVLALLGNTVSIAFFNFAGISVTKEISATTRMVLDSLRTVVIWVVSLALGWEQFHGLQVLGFIVLLVGAALYNGLHRPLLAKIPCCANMVEEEEGNPAERARLLDEGRVQEET